MSTWSARAIERLGHPDPAWPSIFGPASGADPVAANGLATLDLTPFLAPLSDFSQQMERDLARSSFGGINLDLKDANGTLAAALGPFSATLATASRYFGPWIEVTETWAGPTSALRFRGYLDEASLQWSEKEARTQASVIHASQLLRERLITDFPSLLRPWPSVPTNASQEFTQSTADALLAAVSDFTPRGGAAAIEAGLWASGQLSWVASSIQAITYRLVYHPDSDPTQSSSVISYPLPTAPAASVIIGGTAYAVDHLAWDTSISGEYVVGDPATNGTVYGRLPVRIYLQGAPDLTGLLTLGATVQWGIPEAQRTHYLLNGSTIAAPAAGSDGQKSIRLNTVEQLAPGDILSLTFLDATSGTPRKATADLPRIIDLDGETGTAFLAEPLTQGYTNVSKVRRNSQDPVLFDGLAYAQALVAPFALDASQFVAAPTDLPVLVWQAYDVAAPALYGAHNLQTTQQDGTLRVARRGPDNGSSAYPAAGVWAGAWGGAWSWQGLPVPEATHQIFGDVLQWPGGANPYTAPVIYIEGDLSGGAATPPNGWRHHWRSWKAPNTLTQDPESTWNGTAVSWAATAASGDIPAKLVAFAASTPTPGRYARTSAGTWSFQAHSGNATLATAGTPTLTGSLPSGNWLALGLGAWASGDEQEALLGLVATGSAFPFTEVKAVLLSQASGGDLTLRQTASLWATGAIPAGPWALGGGLVVQTWQQTIDGLDYPHTVLHKLNGSTVLTADLKTLEVIPQTIQPLLLTGTAGAKVLGGWYALALETTADENYTAARRLRFLHLNAQLQVVNGVPEFDPSTPTDAGAYFSRGELIASLVPDGALLARMVRTSNTANRMAGLIGGRLFTVASELPTTVEHLKLGATVPAGAALTVANSGDGMSVADYLEKFAATQLATAVPAADGSMALVSRAAGTLRARTVGATKVSVQAAERGERTQTLVWEGYIRKVRVTCSDILTGETVTVEEEGTFQGGRVAELDVADLVSSRAMSRALGRAWVHWFGQPAGLTSETWIDRSHGVAGGLGPAYWAGWNVGDLITFTPYNPAAPTPVTVFKVLRMKPRPEAREVAVELRQQPFQITPEA